VWQHCGSHPLWTTYTIRDGRTTPCSQKAAAINVHDNGRIELQTKSYDVSVRDDAGSEVEEGFVDVVSAFPADA